MSIRLGIQATGQYYQKETRSLNVCNISEFTSVSSHGSKLQQGHGHPLHKDQNPKGSLASVQRAPTEVDSTNRSCQLQNQ